MQNVPPAALVRIDPGAAAASLKTASPLEPDAVFAVYRLGRSSFHAAAIRRVGDVPVVVAERTEPIGGAEFDGLLLAYLSGRHPDAGARLWSRIENPVEATDRQLRALLLEKITSAREQLSERDFTVITVPTADIKMPLTRDELESRIEELVESTADVLEETLTEAGVHPAELAGLLLAGGAARTPLVATTLRRRFGIEPILASPKAKVLAAEAAPVATRELPFVDEEAPPRRRGPGRTVVIAAALLVVVAAGAAFGSGLGDGDTDDNDALADESAPAATASDSASAASTEPGGTPSTEASASPSESPTPEEGQQGPQDPVEDETSSADAQPTTESAPTGTVPNLVGLSTADAHQAVEEAGFAGVEQTGEQRDLFDWSYEDCEIIEQSPRSGAKRALSETVQVTFSYSGEPSDCDV
ncbi:Hsp70 family protein [Glycomyces rhizosphaerae]|uniref:Hsp70 family protein n=1 Tax=Glycomyces rhizosphaerae TaxID=2054422 RepID=A0ABV7PS14_9ACTN